MRFYFHFIARDMEGDINLMRKEKNYLEHELNTQPNGQRKKYGIFQHTGRPKVDLPRATCERTSKECT